MYKYNRHSIKIRELLKMHPEWLLTGAALLLLGILAVFFVWSITGLAADFGKAVVPGTGKGSNLNFDLESAKRLNLKGLVQ